MNAAGLSAGFRGRQLSPVEVARALLDRIARLDPQRQRLLPDRCGDHTGSRPSLARRAGGQGAPLSPLDGVPVAIKDLLLTRGWPTLRGSRTIDPGQDWNDDAPAVARLAKPGAVLLGKTTTPGIWLERRDGFAAHRRHPQSLEFAKDPGRFLRRLGGGAGGAAGAAGHRHRWGRSIRIPASFSGVFGLKPTYGRVPACPLSPFGTLAHIGPMSRDVEGSAHAAGCHRRLRCPRSACAAAAQPRSEGHWQVVCAASVSRSVRPWALPKCRWRNRGAGGGGRKTLSKSGRDCRTGRSAA